jgi:O-antigen/teichoic acid export membrane protein
MNGTEELAGGVLVLFWVTFKYSKSTMSNHFYKQRWILFVEGLITMGLALVAYLRESFDCTEDRILTR